MHETREGTERDGTKRDGTERRGTERNGTEERRHEVVVAVARGRFDTKRKRSTSARLLSGSRGYISENTLAGGYFGRAWLTVTASAGGALTKARSMQRGSTETRRVSPLFLIFALNHRAAHSRHASMLYSQISILKSAEQCRLFSVFNAHCVRPVAGQQPCAFSLSLSLSHSLPLSSLRHLASRFSPLFLSLSLSLSRRCALPRLTSPHLVAPRLSSSLLASRRLASPRLVSNLVRKQRVAFDFSFGKPYFFRASGQFFATRSYSPIHRYR